MARSNGDKANGATNGDEKEVIKVNKWDGTAVKNALVTTYRPLKQFFLMVNDIPIIDII